MTSYGGAINAPSATSATMTTHAHAKSTSVILSLMDQFSNKKRGTG